MGADGKQRIDKWLFFARAVKSRALAAKLALAGGVKINDKISDGADNAVHIGDLLTIRLDQRQLIYKVVALGERRGPAPEAQALYEDLTPVIPRFGQVLHDAVRDPGAGRPEKKERRALEEMRRRIFGDN